MQWSWSGARRQWLLYKEGNGDLNYDDGGALPDWCGICWGDPAPSWLDECDCRCNSFCQYLLGSRGYHHPGGLYSYLQEVGYPGEMFPDQWSRTWRPDGETVANTCEYSRMMCRYPWDDCNKHTMDNRIAAELASMAINGLVGLPVPVPPPSSIRSRKMPARRKPLCKMYRGEFEDKVSELLKRGGQRRSLEFQPKRVAWAKRPGWNGRIVNLTPVTHDARPQNVVVSAAPC